jgi:3-hydroxyacyl-CoA dehydrogenase
MAKNAISVTLDTDNLLWLRGRAAAAGSGNLSETLDALVTDARLAGRVPEAAIRTVVDTIDIAADDPDLSGADDVIRAVFDRSLARLAVAREALPRRAMRRAARKRRTRG